MPPLRDRPEDIPLLVSHFLQKNAAQTGLEPRKIEPEAIDLLCAYAWPGNVRELHNVLERAAILSAGRELRLPPGALPTRNDRPGRPLTWEAQERTYLERLLRHAKGKIAGADGAAALAGLAPSTLLSRLEKLRLQPRDFREA